MCKTEITSSTSMQPSLRRTKFMWVMFISRWREQIMYDALRLAMENFTSEDSSPLLLFLHTHTHTYWNIYKYKYKSTVKHIIIKRKHCTTWNRAHQITLRHFWYEEERITVLDYSVRPLKAKRRIELLFLVKHKNIYSSFWCTHIL